MLKAIITGTRSTVRPVHALLCLACLLLITGTTNAQRIRIVEEDYPTRNKKEVEPAPSPPRPGMIEARFNDDGRVWINVIDETVKLVTPYGPLEIPYKDIRRVQFAVRLSKDETKRIEDLIKLLADDDFERREAASHQLADFGPRAYPRLWKERKHPVPEVKRRIMELINAIKEGLSDEALHAMEIDVIHTHDAKMTGKLSSTSIKVQTIQFGEVDLKITDLSELRHPDYVEPQPVKKKKKKLNMDPFAP